MMFVEITFLIAQLKNLTSENLFFIVTVQSNASFLEALQIRLAPIEVVRTITAIMHYTINKLTLLFIVVEFCKRDSIKSALTLVQERRLTKIYFSVTVVYGFVCKSAKLKCQWYWNKKAAEREKPYGKLFRRISCGTTDISWWQIAKFEDIFSDALVYLIIVNNKSTMKFDCSALPISKSLSKILRTSRFKLWGGYYMIASSILCRNHSTCWYFCQVPQNIDRSCRSGGKCSTHWLRR